MGLDEVPQEFRDKLRWLPDPAYHVPLVRHVMEAMIFSKQTFFSPMVIAGTLTSPAALLPW